jgi:hypothetical protein
MELGVGRPGVCDHCRPRRHVETLVLRVRLTDDALLVTDLRGSRRYPK